MRITPLQCNLCAGADNGRFIHVFVVYLIKSRVLYLLDKSEFAEDKLWKYEICGSTTMIAFMPCG